MENGVAGPASARTVSEAAPVLVSSAWNWIQALVMTAPDGMPTAGNRSPTVCTFVSSVTNSRSLESKYIQPCGNSSTSSDPEATRRSIVTGAASAIRGNVAAMRASDSAPSAILRQRTAGRPPFIATPLSGERTT